MGRGQLFISQFLKPGAVAAFLMALVACGRGSSAPGGPWVTYAAMYAPSVHAYDAKPTVDGGAVVAGVVEGVPGRSNDAWVTKLDASGNIEWQRSYGGPYADVARIVHPTTDGGYVVAGNTSDLGGNPGWLLKLDANGNVQWKQAYGGGGSFSVNGMQLTPDAGYVIVGSFESSGAAVADVWVMKVDAAGAIVWQRTYGGVNADLGEAIAVAPDGGYLVAASTYSFGSGRWDAWILKLDASGSIQWQETHGGPEDDWVRAIQATVDGGVVFTGGTSSSGLGGGDVWAVKLDANGNVHWQSSLGGTSVDEGHAIAATADGGYVIAGQLNIDAWVVKLDASGTVVWESAYRGAGPGVYVANAVRRTMDDGYVVAGSGGDGAFVVKLDASGRIPGCANTTPSQVTVMHIPPTVATTAVVTALGAAVPTASTLIATPTAVLASRLCLNDG